MPQISQWDKKYPNSSLDEVVCEVQFPGILDIECRRNEFYYKIKEKYPYILLPSIKPEQPPSIAPYRFQDKDNSQNANGIMLAINRFSYYQRDYDNHVPFKEEFIRLLGLLKETYPLEKLNRIGWRYINLIPFVREKGLIPIQRYLNLNICLPEDLAEKHTNFSLALSSKVQNGIMTLRIESVRRKETNEEVILLDWDYGITKDIELQKIDDYLEEAHCNTRRLFEELITDKYRQYLRGEEI